MNYNYPLTIDNNHGEKLTFKELKRETDGDRILVENFVAPGKGPIMHSHWLQGEALTVVNGTIGYQILGQPEQFGASAVVLGILPITSSSLVPARSGMQATRW